MLTGQIMSRVQIKQRTENKFSSDRANNKQGTKNKFSSDKQMTSIYAATWKICRYLIKEESYRTTKNKEGVIENNQQ